MTTKKELFPNARTVFNDNDRLLGIGPVFIRKHRPAYSYYVCTTSGDVIRFDEQTLQPQNTSFVLLRDSIEVHRENLILNGKSDELVILETLESFSALVHFIRTTVPERPH